MKPFLSTPRCPGRLFLPLLAAVLAPGFRVLPAAAAPFPHRVELRAPYELGRVLADSLEIIKWEKSPRMNEVFFRRLFNETPEQIRMVMATEGFFNPGVNAELLEEETVTIARFTVEPGPPSRVSRVTVELAGALLEHPDGEPSPAAVRGAWPLPEGARFSQQAWEAAKRALPALLARGNYPLARLTASRAEVDPDTNLVVLAVTVDSGPVVTLGELQAGGFRRYPETIAHNLNFIAPGTPHSRAVLGRLRRIMLDSGYFNNVFVDIEPADDDPALAPIRVTVEEKKRRQLTLGLSVNSNTGPGGTLTFEERNLFNRGLRWQNTFAVDRLSREAGTEFFRVPDRRGRVYSVLASASVEEIEKQDLAVTRFGLARAHGGPAHDLVTSLLFRREKRTVGEEETATESLMLNNTWSWERTDDRLAPSRGHLSSIEAGLALAAVLSDRDFARFRLRTHFYHPLSPADVFLLRGEVGVVLAGGRQGVPADALFRAGGVWSVRGYHYQSLGVREGPAITGARYLATASAEYNRWIGRRWALAVFSDWGNARDSLADFRLVHGYGAGVRLRTPVGLLNLDGARGRENRRLTWHFSLGVPF